MWALTFQRPGCGRGGSAGGRGGLGYGDGFGRVLMRRSPAIAAARAPGSARWAGRGPRRTRLRHSTLDRNLEAHQARAKALGGLFGPGSTGRRVRLSPAAGSPRRRRAFSVQFAFAMKKHIAADGRLTIPAASRLSPQDVSHPSHPANAERPARWRVKRAAAMKAHPDVVESELIAAVFRSIRRVARSLSRAAGSRGGGSARALRRVVGQARCAFCRACIGIAGRDLAHRRAAQRDRKRDRLLIRSARGARRGSVAVIWLRLIPWARAVAKGGVPVTSLGRPLLLNFTARRFPRSPPPTRQGSAAGLPPTVRTCRTTNPAGAAN